MGGASRRRGCRGSHRGNQIPPRPTRSAHGHQNERHNNYQDYQNFLDAGGRIGLQHDPLLYGSYALNPYLVRVETAPMLVVKQGEVA